MLLFASSFPAGSIFVYTHILESPLISYLYFTVKSYSHIVSYVAAFFSFFRQLVKKKLSSAFVLTDDFAWV